VFYEELVVRVLIMRPAKADDKYSLLVGDKHSHDLGEYVDLLDKKTLYLLKRFFGNLWWVVTPFLHNSLYIVRPTLSGKR